MSVQSLAAAILLVGHSLTGPTLPAMLADIHGKLRTGGRVENQVIVGSPLHWNWSHSAGAEDVDGRAELATGEIDVLVLTEGLPFYDPDDEWSTTVEDALRWHDLATGANPEAQTYLYELWHDLRSGTGVDVEHDPNDHLPWRERLDLSLADWEYVLDEVNARRRPGSREMLMIPVGQAMARMHDAIAEGSVPGLTSIRDLFADDIHPNDLGWYFIAMVHYATIYGRDPHGLPRSLKDEWGGHYRAPPLPLATRMQEIAWEAVTAYPRSGVTR
jgi:hypothetical protein